MGFSESNLYLNALLVAAFVFGLVVIMGFGAYLYRQILSYKLSKKLKKRFSYARDKEKFAESLLKEAGYLVEETQKTAKLPMWINGKKFSYLVRPDAFATKEGRRYLVEIKTGKVANDPRHSATRRQLLEYFHGFSVDGVLLVDAEAKEIHNVYFHQKVEKTSIIQTEKIGIKLILAFFLGVLAAFLTLYLLSKGNQ